MKKYFLLLLVLITSALLLEGFQCTSPTMSSAKTAYASRDYETAMKYLNQELTQNPTNAEAYLLRAELNLQMRNLEAAASDLSNAQQHAKTEMEKSKASNLIYKLWTNSYNLGLQEVSKYYSTNDPRNLDTALYLLNIGQQIRPEIADFHYYKATVLEMKGDTTGALQAYNKYASELKDEIEFAKANNITLDYPMNKFNQTFGAPLDTRQIMMQDSSVITSALYKIENKDVYVFYQVSKEDPVGKIIGWRMGAPATWSDTEKFQYVRFNLSPYKAIAQIEYSRGSKQATINALQEILVLDPADKDANSSIVQLYQEMGKLDQAMKELDNLTARNPENKFFWAQYGDIYMNLEEYDKAIDKYMKALEVDPAFDLVLRNIGSAFKNKASIIQKQQAEKMMADKKYQPVTEEYFPHLRKSAEYFEKAFKTQRFMADYTVLGELGNIYTVLEEDSKLNRVLKELEALEYSIDEKDQEAYYLILINLYSNNDIQDKLDVTTEKYNKKFGN